MAKDQVNKQMAGGGSGLSEAEIAGALKEALEQGVRWAVECGSQEDGFLNNPLIRIPFPPELHEVESKLRDAGVGQFVDTVVEKLNEAAEKAAQRTLEILVNAVKNMSVNDAASIIKGGESACTKYLIQTCRGPIINEMRPIVINVLRTCGLTVAWDAVKTAWAPIPSIPFVWEKPSIPNDLNEYALGRAADGLFTLCEQKENEIRANISAAVSELVRKVFSALL